MASLSIGDAKPQGNSPESLSRATQNTRKMAVSFMAEQYPDDAPKTLFLEPASEGLLIYPVVEPHPPEKCLVCSTNRQSFSQLPPLGSRPWEDCTSHLSPGDFLLAGSPELKC